jgi:hypothetical protein
MISSKLIKQFVFVFFMGISITVFGQHYAINGIIPKVETDSLTIQNDSINSNWQRINRGSLDISEVAFVNWNAGGTNSISGLLGLEFERNFQKDHMIWKNRAVVRYGVNKQQKQNIRKTDDILELHSQFGFRKDTISNWYYSANFSFNTQFTNGFNYGNGKSKPISKFMAPAYMFLGVGTVYGEHIESFTAYLSPLTLKSTFVLDQDLANAGSFGVAPAVLDNQGNIITKGKHLRREFGVLLTSAYESEVIENISVRNLISLYSDYINDFGNVDVDWEINFNFQVNDYVRASLGSHLKYDDDVKITSDDDDDGELEISGAKVQWKQLLGLGVSVVF